MMALEAVTKRTERKINPSIRDQAKSPQEAVISKQKLIYVGLMDDGQKKKYFFARLREVQTVENRE